MKNILQACRSLAASVLACAAAWLPPASAAQLDEVYDMSLQNLLVVLRETIGANKQDESLVSMGKMKARLADGAEVEVDIAAFDLIGDMHIRFVFDGVNSMRNATREELDGLGLSVDEALQQALTNLHRVYGPPAAELWSGQLMLVSGKSPHLDSSYFLDRPFWRALSKQYPQGLVVGVPKRGGLLYVPLIETEAVEGLRRSIVPLYSSSDTMRVSAALYLFKDDKWTVFQAAPEQE